MADQRRRHFRRNALIFAGSLVGHLVAFFVAISNFQFYPPPPAIETEQPVELQLVPPTQTPPPPFPIVRPRAQPTQQPPPSPPPTLQRQATTSLPQAAPQPTPKVTAPAPQFVRPTPLPAPQLAPMAPPAPAPPTPVPAASLKNPQTHTVNAPHLVLHRDRNAAAGQPSVSIPGAVFAPTPQAQAGRPAGGGAAGGGAHGFPGGALPGFGNGLRDSLVGCANADAVHLSLAERAHCAETFGEGTRETQQMDPIGAARRAVLNGEAASESAAERYRNSTPAGSEATPIAGQPRILTKPGQ